MRVGPYELTLTSTHEVEGGVSIFVGFRAAPEHEPAAIGLSLPLDRGLILLQGWIRAIRRVLEARGELPPLRSFDLHRERWFTDAIERKKPFDLDAQIAFFLEPKRLGKFIPAPPEWWEGCKAVIDEVLTNASGPGSALNTIEPVSDGGRFWVVSEHGLRIVLRLVTFDQNEAGERMVRDIKEQEVLFADLDTRPSPDRLRLFLQAWLEVMPRVLAATDVDTLMPHDLVPADVLAQKAPDTFAEFLSAIERKFAGVLKKESGRS